MCRGQIILTGMGEVVDLNFQAVKIVMDLYEVEDQQECFYKVYKTFHHFLKERKAE
jgi:hypothetical protein